jgi:hypothetical protein
MPEPVVNLYGESHSAVPIGPKRVPLTDPFLLVEILRSKDHPAVKQLSGSEYNPLKPAGTGFHKERKVSVKEVLARIRSSESFVYFLSENGKRVRSIRSVRWRRVEIGPWTECFRTGGNWDEVGAAVLPPSPEWIKRMNANNGSSRESMIWGKSEKRRDANTGFSIRTLKG